MVARPSAPTRSANAGEFSPSAKGRVDIKQYYSAGLAFKNFEPVPQGGFRQMGGSRRKGEWRRPLVSRSITSPSTDAGPHTGTQTVWTGTVAGTVAAVLVTGFDISAGTATFTVEAQVGGNWVAVGGPFAVGDPATAETRLAAFAPGGQQTATALRIVAAFSTSSTVAIASVAAFYEDGTPQRPRFVALTADDGTAYACFVTEGVADFFTEDGFVGSARLSTVTAAMLPDLDFYAEGRTIGIFHGELETVRLFLVTEGQDHDWRSDLWPFESIPSVDLGGSYATTDDEWEIYIRFTGSPVAFLAITVNGEDTPAIPCRNAPGGSPQAIDTATTTNLQDWAAELEDALQALPSLGAGVTVVYSNPGVAGTYLFTVTFGGALSGVEYELSADVVNTTEVAALPYHTQVGDTDAEPLWSVSRGWPGASDLYQDRMVHARNPAVKASLAQSAIGEYFTFNIEAQGDAAARLDKLRSQTNETILAIKESQYLLVFSDRAAYFATNRTIERNTPVNFVKASETGIQPNCKPFDLEGIDYYVAINPAGIADYSGGGKQMLQIVYDDVSTRYNADPVSLLASHLVDRIVRAARQRPLTDLDAAKAWLMRTDGRLVAGQFIKSQEILGFCEWVAAASGSVREIGIDGRNRLWLAVERAGAYTIELYDTDLFLQDSVEATPDLAGGVTGLPWANGTEVWAVATTEAGDWTLGPYTVTDGAIDLEDSYASAIVGRWQAPRFETMPQVYVTPQDDVIWRPGRIHTVHLNLIDTTSLAVGANGQDPEDVPLTRAGDPDGAPPPARTELVTVAGLMGAAEGTTAVVTQTRPGTLRVRDLSIGAKL